MAGQLRSVEGTSRVSVHKANTTASEVLLTVPQGYAFELRYIRIMNRGGTNKSIDMLHTVNSDGSGDVLYIFDDETIATKADTELPDISLVLLGTKDGTDTISVAQDGSSTFDIILSGDLSPVPNRLRLG